MAEIELRGEQLEPVYAALRVVAPSPVPTALGVQIKDARAAMRHFVEAYTECIRPAIGQVTGEDPTQGISLDHKRYGEFLELIQEHANEVHKITIPTIKMSAVLSADEMELDAVEYLESIGIIEDDR
jgi:hypothetical protein